MAFLKSISAHTTCSHRIRDYLDFDDGEPQSRVPSAHISPDSATSAPSHGVSDYLSKNERALGHDFFNIPTVQQKDWACYMDTTRREAGNDSDWRGMRAVTYRHFIVSPSPKDHVSLETLRDLALSWVEENFSDYQVAITYHDDNVNHIPHAHIIVNNTNLATGRRLHLTDADTASLASSLQALAMKRGLEHFENLPGEEAAVDIHSLANYIRAAAHVNRAALDRRPSAQREYLSKAEREARARGVRLWKQDIRDRVLVAMWASDGTEDSFSTELAKLGILAEFREDDILYVTQGQESRRIRSSRLGTDFGRAGLIRISNAATKSSSFDSIRKDSLSSYITDISVLPCELSISELKARRERVGIGLHEVHAALKTISALHIRSIDGAIRLLNSKRSDFDRASLEQAIRVSNALGLLPAGSLPADFLPADSRPVPQPQGSPHSGAAGVKTAFSNAIPLSVKIERGYRLSKAEYARLTPSQLASWHVARRKRSASGSNSDSSPRSKAKSPRPH